MAEPSFLTGGETPRRNDTKWFRWCRMLGHYQNQAGANAANNPKRTDTLRQLKYKLLKAILPIAIVFSPQAPGLSFLGEMMTVTNLDYPGHPADDLGVEFFENSWVAYRSATGVGDPTSSPEDWEQVDINEAGPDVATFENAVSTNWYGAARVLIGGDWSPWAKLQNV